MKNDFAVLINSASHSQDITGSAFRIENFTGFAVQFYIGGIAAFGTCSLQGTLDDMDPNKRNAYQPSIYNEYLYQVPSGSWVTIPNSTQIVSSSTATEPFTALINYRNSYYRWVRPMWHAAPPEAVARGSTGSMTATAYGKGL